MLYHHKYFKTVALSYISFMSCLSGCTVEWQLPVDSCDSDNAGTEKEPLLIVYRATVFLISNL